MRSTSILSRYLLKELLGPFFLALLVFTCVVLMVKVIDLMDMVMNQGLAVGEVLRLIAYLLPSLMIYTLPMSVILAVLLALGRLSADSETTALKACGISLYQMLPPFAVLCLSGFVLTAVCSVYLESAGRRAFRDRVTDLSAHHITATIQEGLFNDRIDGMVIFVREFDRHTREISGIMISDRRDPDRPAVIVAEHGTILSDQQGLKLLFKLFDGSIHRQDASQAYEYAVFDAYEMRLSLDDTDEKKRTSLRQKEMSMPELFEQLHERRRQGDSGTRLLIEIHERFAIPFACLVFGLLGLSLGIYWRRGGRAGGFVLSLIIVLLYYFLMSMGKELAGIVHPAVGMWFPNAVLGSAALYLFYTTAAEKPFPLSRAYNKKLIPLLSRTAERLAVCMNRKQ